MDKLISVIVPIYNVENYLIKCVESILNQSYKNLEIILVDDGSKDNCPTICDEYLKKDHRIKVIHKKNGGLSDARNAGLKIAKGDYISFIDSDDYIDKDMYKFLVEDLIDNNADIAACNIKYVYEIDGHETVKYNRQNCVLNRFEAMEEYIHNGIVQAVVWNKIYKRELIGNLEFEVNKTNEDEFFSYKVISNAEKITYNKYPFYNYLQRQSSIMGNYSLKRLDALDATYERLNFIKSNYPVLYYEEKKNFLFLCIYHYQMILKNEDIDKNKIGRSKILNDSKKIHFNILEFKNYRMKDIIRIVLSKISLDLFCRVMNKLGF